MSYFYMNLLVPSITLRGRPSVPIAINREHRQRNLSADIKVMGKFMRDTSQLIAVQQCRVMAPLQLHSERFNSQYYNAGQYSYSEAAYLIPIILTTA